jgi:hypothetical protein
MYHDGVMQPELEKRFAEHLATCHSCMESLLNLQNDVTAMGTMEYRTVPDKLLQSEVLGRSSAGDGAEGRSARKRSPLFRFVPDMLDMLQDHFGGGRFESVPAPAVRGTECTNYVASILGAGVRLSYEDTGLFCLELTGIRGRSVEIQKHGRVLEKHRDLEHDSIMFESLSKGEYRLSIDHIHAMTFTVQ